MALKSRKIVFAVTGASGAVYAQKLLEKLLKVEDAPSEIAMIFSEKAVGIWEYETGKQFSSDGMVRVFSNLDFFAPFASGSSSYDTMIICPASMGIMGRIANGVSDDLITRAADVMLKERRRLIIVPRETPYNLMHIRNMESLTLAGAVICPATPSFYSKPVTIDDLVMTVVDRIISLAGFDAGAYRWMEDD